MKKRNTFDIQIFGLKNKSYDFNFEITADFFQGFPAHNLFETGSGEVKVELDKNERIIQLKLWITCVVELECDRSLEKFEHPVHVEENLYYHFSVDPEIESHDDNIIYISPNTETINIAQPVYELIGLQIPMRKIHPKYAEDQEDFFYSTDQKDDNTEATQESDDTNESIDESVSLSEKLKILQNRYK